MIYTIIYIYIYIWNLATILNFKNIFFNSIKPTSIAQLDIPTSTAKLDITTKGLMHLISIINYGCHCLLLVIYFSYEIRLLFLFNTKICGFGPREELRKMEMIWYDLIWFDWLIIKNPFLSHTHWLVWWWVSWEDLGTPCNMDGNENDKRKRNSNLPLETRERERWISSDAQVRLVGSRLKYEKNSFNRNGSFYGKYTRWLIAYLFLMFSSTYLHCLIFKCYKINKYTNLVQMGF